MSNNNITILQNVLNDLIIEQTNLLNNIKNSTYEDKYNEKFITIINSLIKTIYKYIQYKNTISKQTIKNKKNDIKVKF